jgi:hypothetical protein
MRPETFASLIFFSILNIIITTIFSSVIVSQNNTIKSMAQEGSEK